MKTQTMRKQFPLHAEFLWLLCQYSHKKMNSFDCCVNIHTKWIHFTVASIFIQNEVLWLLCQYWYIMNSFLLLCQCSNKMKCFGCCLNIDTKWIPFIDIHPEWIPLTAVLIFIRNEFIWTLGQYSYRMNSFDCCVNIHTESIPLTVESVFIGNEFLWPLGQYTQK